LTQELVLFAMNVQPVAGKLFFDWALAGLDRGLEGLEAAKLPRGRWWAKTASARPAMRSAHPRERPKPYVFALYVLPERLLPRQGFDPAELREAVQQISRKAGLLALSYGGG